MKPLTLAAAGITVWVTAPILALAALTAIAGGQPGPPSGGCGTSAPGPVPEGVGLSQQQWDTAWNVVNVAAETGLGARAAVIAVATALQESDLGADPTSHRPDRNFDFGLFQLRALPGWHADADTLAGNLKILADEGYQTRVFLLGHTTRAGSHIPGLADIPGWQTMPLTVAAQRVQRSAYPDAYAKHEPLAQAITDALAACESAADPVGCPPTPARIGNETGLTPDAINAMRCIPQRWPQIRTIGGLRPGDPRDHGTGRAVDVMIPAWTTPAGKALGGQIAAWARNNAQVLGVTYVIWDTRIWSVARQAEGWRPCSRGSCYAGPDPTAAHLDHVHISVQGHHTTRPATGGAAVELPIEKGSYRLTARYGQTGSRWKNLHTGLDFAAPAGTPIRAVAAGVVLQAGNTGGAYGILTKIRGEDGTSFWYAHQSRTDVRPGQHVTAGQVIGAVGATGNVTGPHLHLEIRPDGTPVDPDRWLRAHHLNP